MTPNIILVVDDEPHVLRLLDIELSAEGYVVLKAGSGQEGINKAKEHTPDLIILDVLMPDMNGGEVIQALKAFERTKNIPVIFLTAVLTKEEEHSKQIGVTIDDTFYPAIAKPFNSKEFLDEIDKLLLKTGRKF